MKSTNAENEERLFGQAKAIALSTTNRKPSNILPNILLRLQAKRAKDMFKEQTSESNRISTEATAVHTPTNTKVTLEFVSTRLDSWQLHLEEISCYLVEGEGTWWRTCNDQNVVFEFYDTQNGNDEPKPHHFRTADFSKLKELKRKAWQRIINSDIVLPTPMIKLYNHEGQFISHKMYPNFITTENTDTDIDTTLTAADACITPVVVTEPDDEINTTSKIPPIDEHRQVPNDIVSYDMTMPPTIEDTEQPGELPTQTISGALSTSTTVVSLNTKLGNTLLSCLKPQPGNETSLEIQELDTLRQKIKGFKSEKCVSLATQQRYRMLMTNMREKLRRKMEDKGHELHRFEMDYFHKYNTLPECTDKTHKSMIHEKNYIRKPIQLLERET